MCRPQIYDDPCPAPNPHTPGPTPRARSQDSVNRRFTLMFLLEFAHKYSDRQFLFLTPQVHAWWGSVGHAVGRRRAALVLVCREISGTGKGAGLA